MILILKAHAVELWLQLVLCSMRRHENRLQLAGKAFTVPATDAFTTGLIIHT